MSLLEDGANLRKELRPEAFGQSILYRRGSTLSAAITARPAFSDQEIDSTDAQLYVHSTDFIFAQSDAVWSETSETFVPQAGDKIDFNGNTYEVAASGVDQIYNDSDHLGISWRVHTSESYD